MSTIDRSQLGGFEERLLAQLKTHIANQPMRDSPLDKRAVTRRRLVYLPRAGSMMTAAAAVAMLVAVLNLLPGGGQTALAQAFPILSQQPQRLPARLERLLQTERLPASAKPTGHDLAYAFRAPAGTGYVVVDQQRKWICLVVPGFGGSDGNVPCETTSWLLSETRRGLRLTAQHQGSTDIVELLPTGSTATLVSKRSAHTVALHDGILTVVTRRPVSITTTVRGRVTTSTYDVTGKADGR